MARVSKNGRRVTRRPTNNIEHNPNRNHNPNHSVHNKNHNKKNLKKKKGPLRFFKIFFITLLCVIIIGSAATLGVVLAMIKTAPTLDINGTILNLNQPSTLYDDSNKPMDTVITTEKRTVVSLNSIPSNLSNAFVSIEDERFYKHGGIDPKRIASALFLDVLNKIHKQNDIQGASTITQELIKQRMFLTDSLQNRLSLKRKVQEAYLAVQLEKSLSKNQILEAYMNTIYLGGQANGVEAASQQYFNTNVSNLNLIQCAFIAGLTQSPSKYYPFSADASKNPAIYINRTKLVLSKMLENNYISQNDYNNAINDLNSGKLVFSKGSLGNDKYNYPWFSDAAVTAVKKDLKSQYNYTDEQVNNLITNGGLKIYTTMNAGLEQQVQKIMDDPSSFSSASASFTVNSKQIREPQSSAVVTDYRTGEVKVLIGGTGSQPAGSYNRAYSSVFRTPVGSSIKPLTVYAPAIESKAITAGTVVDDSPLPDNIASKYSGDNGSSGYQPHNDYIGYTGPQTVATAIEKSINVIAVKVEDQIGVSTGVAYAQKFGLPLDASDKTSTSIAAMALGQLKYGTNSMIMSSAYGTFGNNGIYVTPRLYTKVVDSKGNTILDNSQAQGSQVISPQTAYIMYNLLKGPVSPGGTGPSASGHTNMPIAGKTGTTSNGKNLWFCGLSPYYSAAVWIGNDDQSRINGAFNSNTSANVWGLIMAEVTKNLPIKDLTPPDGLTNIDGQFYINGTAPSVQAPAATPSQPQQNTVQNQVNNTVQNTAQQQNNTTTNNAVNNVTGTGVNTSVNNNNNNNNQNSKNTGQNVNSTTPTTPQGDQSNTK